MNTLHFTLLKIRWLQGKRLLREMGPFFPFLMGALLLALLFILQSYINRQQYAWYISGAVLFIVASVHLQRKDLLFVQRHVFQNRFQLFTEYFVFALPVNLLTLFSTHWYCFFLLTAGMYLITYLRPPVLKSTSLRQLKRIVPAHCFEWSSGLRKNYLQLGFLYLLALAFAWVKILPLVLLWICNTMISTFYQESESLVVLRAESMNSRSFLLSKIKRHSLLLLLLFSPVLVLNSIFQPGLIWVTCFFVPLQLSLLCFAILLKYSVYEPGSPSSSNTFLLGLVTISCIIPFLLPISLLLCIRTYASARDHLKNYLYDQH